MGSTRTRSLWSYSCDPGRLLRVSEGAIRKAGLAVPLEERDRYGGFRPTPEVIEAWERTRAVALTLEAPIVVFQCPASFTPTLEHIAHLRTFFERVERAGLLFAWEPRGNWPEETVAALCRDLDLIHCVDPFARRPAWAGAGPGAGASPAPTGVAYFRLHGIGGYRYRYTDADLDRLLEWCCLFETAYVLFNNVSMWDDALHFRERTGGCTLS